MIVPLLLHLKARARLHPLFRFNLPVLVQVRTEVAMANDAATGKVIQYLAHQQPEMLALRGSTRICGTSLAVQSTLVADADAVLVETLCVCTDSFQRTGRFYVAVLADIKVVARTLEAPAAVAHFKVLFREIPVRP